MNPDASPDRPAGSGTPFDNEKIRPRQLRPGQRSQLWVANVETGSSEMLLESTELLFEAPNWTSDGANLIVNGNGGLWSIPVAAPALIPIGLQDVPDLNNDHVLDPDGEHIYVSAMDWHIYRVPLRGGAAHRVSGTSEGDGLLHSCMA